MTPVMATVLVAVFVCWCLYSFCIAIKEMRKDAKQVGQGGKTGLFGLTVWLVIIYMLFTHDFKTESSGGGYEKEWRR